MLPAELASLTQGLLEPYLRSRRRILEQDLAEIQAKMSAQGVGMGSPALVLAFNRCAEEIEHRLGFAWATLKRVLQSGRVEIYDGIDTDIEVTLASYYATITADVIRTLEKRLRVS